jgi:hypothetical protein
MGNHHWAWNPSKMQQKGGNYFVKSVTRNENEITNNII